MRFHLAWLLASGVVPFAQGQEVLSAEERLPFWNPTPTAETPLREPSAWPTPTAFEAVWSRRQEAQPLHVIRARVSGSTSSTEADMAVWQDEGSWRVASLWDRTSSDPGNRLRASYWPQEWKLVSGRLDGPETIRFERNDSSLVLTEPQPAPRGQLPDGWFANWVYATTLVQAHPDRADDAEIPMGFCSMDRGPTDAAAALADRALMDRRTGRFLRMRLRILGDAFGRVAWTPEGADARGPDARELTKAPIDLDRFLTGLVLQFDGGPSILDIDPDRLGRAVAESGRLAAMETRLQSIVEDESVDTWNRLRALFVLASAWRHRSPEGQPRLEPATTEDVAPKFKELRLPDAGRRWLGLP